jgi:putative FmdB family regulatory protein
MPSYEYLCERCQKEFLVVMSIKEHDVKKVECPHCKGQEVHQLLTSFIAKTAKKS